MQLWQDRQSYFSMLKYPPQTLCHFDANRRNLFIRRTRNTSTEVIAIIWSYVGYGAIGSDIMVLIVEGVISGKIALDDAETFANVALEGYITGLEDVGWKGNPDLVHLGYNAGAIQFRLGAIRFLLTIILDEERRDRFEKTVGVPLEVFLDCRRKINSYLDGMLTKANELYAQLGRSAA